MTDYVINWSDDNLKPPFKLIGGTVDTTTTSLGLCARGTINWGERLQENLIHLLENFASIGGNSPDNPTVGQLWFNDDTKYLNLYYDDEWHELRHRIIHNATTPVGVFYPGDLWFDTSQNILKVYENNGTWVTACSQCVPATPTGTPEPTGTPAPTPTSTPTPSNTPFATWTATPTPPPPPLPPTDDPGSGSGGGGGWDCL